MAPILGKSLNRLSREAIIDLGLRWLQESRSSSAPYLQCNRTGIEADEEDYLHIPAGSIEELRTLYRDLRNHPGQATKRDVVDRIIDGDWRRGLSLHQHATIDFAYLEQNHAALKWSALKLVPLKTGDEKSLDDGEGDDDDGQQPAKKRRKLSDGRVEPKYPHVSPQVFLSALKAEISPLVKAHYHLHRMPSPYNLTILRLWIQPNAAFAPSRSKVPRRPKQATDAGRIMYIALPDSCPYVYISISGSSTSSNGRSKGSVRDAKEKVMAKVDMAAMKRIVLEAIPKALSRPHQRWALESTNLVAKSLKTMCELRGNQKPGTSGGAYSIFADCAKAVDKSPVDVQMTADDSEQRDNRQRLIEKRFGHTQGEHYAPLNRVHVKLTNAIPPDGLQDEDSSSAQHEITLTFMGSDVFAGLKKLAELAPTYMDLDKTPAWMTGELGVSNLTV
jgi:central kinetochore subunit Mis15/CHL4